MGKHRDIDLDILRTLIIISALILHYNSNIYIGILAIPSAIVQHTIFTVGGFFFFTAGYMARKVYYNKYITDPTSQSKKIFYKGLNIFLIYLSYVFLMRVFKDSDFPNGIIQFLFDHNYYTKVLFTFGVLYMITPLILYLVKVCNNLILLLSLLIITFIVILYNPDWPLPYSFKILLLDRKLFLYPILSSIIIYSSGFLIAGVEVKKLITKVPTPAYAILCISAISIHLFLFKYLSFYHDLIRNRQFFTLVESVTPYIAIVLIRYSISISKAYKVLSSPYVLCIGIFSLHFYVISNLLLGLLDITGDSTVFIRLMGLLGISVITYLFTFWRFNIANSIKSLSN